MKERDWGAGSEGGGGLFVTTGKPGKSLDGGNSPRVQGESGGWGWAQNQSPGDCSLQGLAALPHPCRPPPALNPAVWVVRSTGSPGGPVSA